MTDSHKRIVEWAKQLEYKGKIPNSLKTVCGPATRHIWEQLMFKVKPKQEIELIRNNITIYKLTESENPAHRNDTLTKQIEVYERRRKLKIEIPALQDDIFDKTRELDNLERTISLKSNKLEKLKEEVRDNKQKTFLYQRKSEQFEKDILNVQEKLDFAVSVTPTEEQQDEGEVLETLKKCAEKIKKSLKQNDLGVNQSVTSSFLNEMVQSNTIIKQSNQNMKTLNDEEFTRDIKKILCENNFNRTWNLLSNLIQKGNIQLGEAVGNKNYSRPQVKTSNSEALNNLYATNIENKLSIMKCNYQIKNLETIINNKKMEINAKFDSLSLPPFQIEAIREIFALQLKEVCATASLDALKAISATLHLDESTIEKLKVVKLKQSELREKLAARARRIDSMLGLFSQKHQDISASQRETVHLLGRLRELTDDLSWLAILRTNSNSQEIETFKQFKLSYNRKCDCNENKVFVRDVLEEAAGTSNVDRDVVEMVRVQAGNMYETQKFVLCVLLQVKGIVDSYKTMLSTPGDMKKYQKYSMDDLEQQEQQINRSLCKLETILRENTAMSSKHSSSQIQKALEFWLEIPIKDFVSPERLFEGKNFSYYQKLYDNCYNKL